MNNFKYLNRISEKKNNFIDLFLHTKFIKLKKLKNTEKLNSIILTTTFENINFNKKRISLFLVLLETICLQKTYKNISRKPLIFLNIKKGSFIGCKITLRNQNLYNFLDSLILFLPQVNYRLNTKFLNKNDISFNFMLTQIINFHEFFNIKQNILNKINLNFLFSSWLLEEKLFILTGLNLPVQFSTKK